MSMDIINALDSLTYNIYNVFKGNVAIIKKYDCWNAVDGNIIGTGESDYTKEFNSYTCEYNGKEVSFLDVPGIEGRESLFEEQIQKGVNKAHIVLYINGTEKKPEVKTVEKIKKYINTDTDVYAVSNIPCKAQKNRIIGSYEVDLRKKYEKAEGKLLAQTNDMLKPILGDNLKGCLCVNGMLAFCGLAYNHNNGTTTIIPDTTNKVLREEQIRYAMDLNRDYDKMLRLSRINSITEIIETHLDDMFIVEANKKKLLSKFDDLIKRLEEHHAVIKKRKEVINDKLSRLEDSLDTAHKNFESSIQAIPRSAVSGVITLYKDEFYKVIEDNEGDIEEDQLKDVVSKNKRKAEKQLQKSIEDRFKQAIERLQDEYKSGQKQLQEDLKTLTKYQKIEMFLIDSVDIESIINELGYSFKDFTKDLKSVFTKIVSFSWAGFEFGGPVGAAIGAAIGAIVGIAMRIYDWVFLSKSERISKAKRKVNDSMDDAQVDLIKRINNAFIEKNIFGMAQERRKLMHTFIGQQKEVFNSLDQTFLQIIKQLRSERKKIGELDYGKI